MEDLENLARRQARAQNGLDPTHVRQQPWFVGSGRALMLLVVSIVIVLVALRGVTMVWLAQDAWRWWASRPVDRAALSPSPTLAPPAQLALPPGARAATGADAAAWITSEDYPAESITQHEQGTSTIRWRIGAEGQVDRCGVVWSSGSTRRRAARSCAAPATNRRATGMGDRSPRPGNAVSGGDCRTDAAHGGRVNVAALCPGS